MFHQILRRWLIIPAMALGLTICAGVSNAQFGPYHTWCLDKPIQPGWHKVGKPFYSFLCSGTGNNAIKILPD
jgi:hypothetical protein